MARKMTTSPCGDPRDDRYAFLDRDGTLIEEPADEQIDALAKYRLLPGAAEGLKRLHDAGFRLVLVTNQDGLGTERYPRAAYERVQAQLAADLAAAGVRFADVLVCPHLPSDGCACRKPSLGLFEPYLADMDTDWPRSFVIGDRATDVQLARALGAAPILVSRNLAEERDFSAVAARVLAAPRRRTSCVARATKETTIRARVHLDGQGVGRVRTGLGFFDHMLTALCHHAAIDYWIAADGDLNVDEHHTVEDTALVLGQTIGEALGERRGIMRFGFVLPMDDALAHAAIDLGGRPYCVFRAKFAREKVGDLPTELVEHFFYTLAMQLKANIHIRLLDGKNTHHAVEALFKAMGRTLRMACEADPRRPEAIASTKGRL